MRALPFFSDQFVHLGTGRMAFERAGLAVEPPQRAEFLVTSELRLLNSRLPHLDPEP
jgi:hypothetical protein